MTKPLLYILKVYILSLILSGVFILIKLDKHYTSGLLLGSVLVLYDILLLSVSFRRKNLTYSRAIVYTFLRLFLLSLVILIMFICGIINRLNIVGLFIALLLYPLALVIGGVRIVKWKR